MIFTIEPMINLGRPHVKVLSDGWTAVTRDRSLSAQYEHTVGVTDDGCEIFTLSPKRARPAGPARAKLSRPTSPRSCRQDRSWTPDAVRRPGGEAYGRRATTSAASSAERCR